MSGKKKTQYDWSKYNKELVNRGKRLANRIKTIKTGVIEFWDEELKRMNEGKEGARYKYPNSMMVFFSILRSAFNINSYRNLEGIGVLFFDNVPDYTVINRRIRKLDLDILKKINKRVTKAKTKDRVIEISLDGTGVQVNGKYVWNENKHNREKMRKRNWKKINIAIDIETRQILGIKVLDRNENEGSHENTIDLVGDVFKNIDTNTKIGKVYADGGYDSYKNFEMFEELGIESVIRIRERSREIAHFMKNKCKDKHRKLEYFRKKRNKISLKQFEWKKYVEDSGYGKRSGVEGVIGSFKRFFREKLFSRIDDMIEREIMTKVLVWNMMM